jgi:hypothetical protein
VMTLERNHVLSRMSGTTPGAVDWSTTLVWRVLVYAGVPLLSLLALEFPEIGGTILKWIEPVQRVL